MQMDPTIIDRMLHNAQKQLLAQRAPHGAWEGELSSSALATATAVFALSVVERYGGGRYQQAAKRGLAWLDAVQNDDGGSGDRMNICRLAFSTASARIVLIWGSPKP